MKKRYLKLIAGFMCFKNVQPISHYWWAIFSASRMKLSSSWKICSPIGLTNRLTWQITKKLGCGRGSSCQPLHVHYSFDGSRSLTTLTTPRREHQGGGRRWGLGRGWRGAGEDAAVDAHAERSTRVRWFGCGVRLPSPQNNRGCGWVEGWPGQ